MHHKGYEKLTIYGVIADEAIERLSMTDISIHGSALSGEGFCMRKPIVFLSHSTRDSNVLQKIKEYLDIKLGGAVDLFLSGDGESIPLGRNWVHRIEEALELCELMFVFITPQSFQSKWIYFEAGYAYAKKTRVVPVALLETSLTHLESPLSLLQGFNVRSFEGLNNLIAIINDQYSFKFLESFTQTEYDQILHQETNHQRAAFGAHSRDIDYIRFTFPEGLVSSLDKIESVLSSQNLSSQKLDDSLYSYGLSCTSERSSKIDEPRAVINLDPELIRFTFPLVMKVFDDTAPNTPRNFRVIFRESIRLIQDRNRVTSRIYGTEITFAEAGLFRYGIMLFSLGNYVIRPQREGSRQEVPYLDVHASSTDFDDLSLENLIALLFERGILYSTSISGFD
jgi:hypothetical protein